MPVSGPATRRSSPLAPDERRAEILRRIAPLLISEGLAVTTRRLAEAAGIGEGTLFRAFGDKAGLLRAAGAQLLDPQPLITRLDAVEPGAPLEQRLTEAVAALLERSREVGALMSALHAPTHDGTGGDTSRRHPWSGREWFVVPVAEALARLLHQHAGELRQPPEAAAWLLTSLTLTAASPAISPALEAAGLVDLALHGLQVTTAASTGDTAARSC